MTRLYYIWKFRKLDKLRRKTELQVDYGTVEELFSSRSCPICSLILQVVPMEVVLLCANPATTGVDGRAQEHVHLLELESWLRREFLVVS
jgi:hypothetical protein